MVCPGKIRTTLSLNALKADGKTHSQMDQSMDQGMAPDLCADRIIKAVKTK